MNESNNKIADIDEREQMQQFRLHQLVMLSEKSFGQQLWSGPGKIVKIKKKTIRVQFDKYAADYLPEHLRPNEDFCKQGEEYVLKTGSQVSDPVPDQNWVLAQNKISALLVPSFPPEVQLAPFPQPPDLIQIQAINQPEQKQCELIRAVRGKARQLIDDQQTEDLVIN